MTPRIVQLQEKLLLGKQLSMSLVQNKTAQLWGQFAPQIKEIVGRVSQDKISLQVYPSDYYQNFSPQKEFVKWAAVEVDNLSNIPKGLESFVLKEGLYAVFDYKGSSSDPSIFNYIFTQWIPNSDYVVDNRPHFEVLGEKYRNNNPESEEEIWIPIKIKS